MGWIHGVKAAPGPMRAQRQGAINIGGSRAPLGMLQRISPPLADRLMRCAAGRSGRR